MAKKLQLTGHKMGLLLVIEQAPTKRTQLSSGYNYPTTMWRCKCDCGNETIVSTQYLTASAHREKRKSPPSCGCFKYVSGRFTAKLDPKLASLMFVINHYRNKANQRNVIWNLPADLAIRLITSHCFYCSSPPAKYANAYTAATGRPLRSTEPSRIEGANLAYNGIDRVSPTRGYVADNVVPCCFVCNRAKNDMLYDDFIIWIQNLVTAWQG